MTLYCIKRVQNVSATLYICLAVYFCVSRSTASNLPQLALSTHTDNKNTHTIAYIEPDNVHIVAKVMR